MNRIQLLPLTVRRLTSFTGRNALKQVLMKNKRTILYLGCAGTSGMALAPLLRKGKLKEAHAEDSEVLEKFRNEADLLYNVYLIENAYNVLRRFASGRDVEMLWRLSRILCEKAKMTRNEKEKKEHYFKAFELAQRALDNEDTPCWQAHLWYAITLSYVSQYGGLKAQLRNAQEVRRHLERALDVNSTEARVWHALGVWFFTYADFPAWKRVLASIFLATPPSASYEDALKCLEKAEYIRPKYDAMNMWYLAEVKDRIGSKKEALELYKETFGMPVVTMDDGDAHDRAHKKLLQLGVKDLEKLLK